MPSCAARIESTLSARHLRFVSCFAACIGERTDEHESAILLSDVNRNDGSSLSPAASAPHAIFRRLPDGAFGSTKETARTIPPGLSRTPVPRHACLSLFFDESSPLYTRRGRRRGGRRRRACDWLCDKGSTGTLHGHSLQHGARAMRISENGSSCEHRYSRVVNVSTAVR
jgi:hypothetical protein